MMHLLTSARMPRLKFFGKLHHFCIRYRALYVPQLLIEKMKLVDFWSGPVPSGRVDLVVVKPPFSNKFTLPLTLQLH